VIFRYRMATVVGGPLDGHQVRIYPAHGAGEPRVITLAHGCTDAEPWPHAWLDYHRQPDGTYHWAEPLEASA
jgi:hypothetical protein